MMLKLFIVFVILIPVSVSAQLDLESRQIEQLIRVDIVKVNISSKSPMAPVTAPKSSSILYSAASAIPTYQPRHYGVFCRIESKIEKKSIISPRFRLGSSAYVDMLEGKY